MPVRMNRVVPAGRAALLAAVGVAALGVLPATAQFGTIFGDPPPRPPGNVPSRPPVQQQQQPQQQIQQDRPPPPLQRQSPGESPITRAPPGAIQSQPLPPPPGVNVPPDPRQQQPAQQQQQQPQQSGLPPGQPPGQRPLRGTTAPSTTAPQPGDEVIDAPPTQKIPNGQAVFSGLDKITGRIINFDVALNETVQFGALQVVPRVCYTRPPTEAANTDAFIEVSEVTLQGEVRRIFTGWMFASSPGLHGVEHPIYDVWLTDCKQPLTKVAEEPQPEKPVPPQQQRPQRQQQQSQPQQGQPPQQRPTLPSNVPQQRAFPTPIR